MNEKKKKKKIPNNNNGNRINTGEQKIKQT